MDVKRLITLVVALVLALVMCSGCSSNTAKTSVPTSSGEQVTLTLCGSWTSVKAFETVAQAFTEKYPQCTVAYEYLQNYETSLVTRLENAPDTVDLFVSGNIQADSPNYPYALELYGQEGVDLSATNAALMTNAALKQTDPSAKAQIYAVPMGGEIRTLYVNKTLLATLGLEVPGTLDEMLAACKVLKDAGYIPMQGNPGVFGQRLLYPYICNIIAHAEDYQATYDRVNSCEPGVSELFRQPMQIMYDMMANGYYNYKYVETELNGFIDLSNEGTARYFLNIMPDGEGFKKVDDVGQVAFASGTLTQLTTFDKIKEDYHSQIDYVCILAPVSQEGGYGYISPAQDIAINKNSKHVDWAVKFLNFFFSKEGSTLFAKDFNVIPNTEDSFGVLQEQFNVPEERVTDLGKATFDYDFYTVVTDTLVHISKGNNPKYMDTDADGNNVLYSFDYYMEELENAFAQVRESRVD